MEDLFKQISVQAVSGNSKYGEEFEMVDIDEAYHYLVETESIPYRIGGGAIFICMSGEAEAMINSKTYLIKKGDLCVLFPYFIIRKMWKSEDFDGYVLGVDMKHIDSIQIPSTISYFLYIKENPCISLSPEEQESLLELCELIRHRHLRSGHIFEKDIADKLLMAICYEIAAIYTNRQPIAQQAYSRNDAIFRQFLFSLGRNYKQHREVSFYAQEQFMSSRYFSSVIKKQSDLAPMQWIQETIIREAKLLLDNRKFSVQQVADELNFPNASFFGQFFKKYTGMTPKKYRDRNR